MECRKVTQVLIFSLSFSLTLTIILELGFFLIVSAIKRSCNKKDLLLVILVNVITNPVVVLLFWLAKWYTDWNIVIILILFETFAVLTEFYLYI